MSLRLQKTLESYASQKSVDDVFDFFARLNIPVPKEHEYYATHDEGAVVFLNQEGCAVRITSLDVYPSLPHPRFLRPVFEQTNDDFHMAVNPGLALLDQSVSVDDLKEELKRENLEVYGYECTLANWAEIPNEEYKILIDPGCIKRMSASAKEVQDALYNTDAQGRFYHDLREKFKTADENGVIDEAWALSRVWKNGGRLVSDWMQAQHRYKGLKASSPTTRVAMNYERALNQYRMAA